MKKFLMAAGYILLVVFLILGIAAKLGLGIPRSDTLSFGAFAAGFAVCLPFSYRKGRKTFISNILFMLLTAGMFVISLVCK